MDQWTISTFGCTLESVNDGGILTPGRYVGMAPQAEDNESFDDKMKYLVAQFRKQQTEGAKLDMTIAENLQALGFWERAE